MKWAELKCAELQVNSASPPPPLGKMKYLLPPDGKTDDMRQNYDNSFGEHQSDNIFK